MSLRQTAVAVALAGAAACGNAPSRAAATPPRARAVKLGAAVNHAYLFDGADGAYAATVAQEFDSLTPEVELKIEALLPQPDTYDFVAADRLVAYAEANGKEVRGHVLVWHRALPAWMQARSWTRDELLAFMQRHISTVMARYRGRITEWDVVNEALNDDGTWRPGLWHDVIGDDYVDAAFRFARAADPNARLWYNDYGAEWVNAKSDALLALATRLHAAGVLDGVGLQAHVSPGWCPSEAALSASMARFAAVGLEVGVTELDVDMGSAPGSSAERLAAEADLYGAIARACQAQPACTRLTTWGVTDRHSWLPAADLPLMFDASYAAKPARAAVRAALGR